jgi:hypothetical protein
MQTFLPVPDFKESARILDYRRLGKQRVEAMQILRGSWSHHPASRMWTGYKDALGEYMNSCIYEWISRGYTNNMELYPVAKLFMMPPWFGMKELHRSHRSNLLRKDPIYYKQFGWTDPPDLPYIWPTVSKGK